MNQTQLLKTAIVDLYACVEKLKQAYPDKPFTPDGRMIGDIGEVIAAIEYGVILDKKLRKHWDGYRLDKNGNKREVQVKATQKDYTYLKKPPHDGDLLVFQIFINGQWKCHYNGDIMKVWNFLTRQNENRSGEKLFNLRVFDNLK